MVLFGDRLKSLRNNRGLSQMDFSKQIGISKSAVNMYERGEREPSFEILETIADYFNVDLDYLIGKSEIPNRSQIQAPVPSPALAPDEEDLLRKYRALDYAGKLRIRSALDVEYSLRPGRTDDRVLQEA
jgi:transcriptional regulator with XRE-family HTH domain